MDRVDAPEVESPARSAPETLGGFRLVRKMAAGGMATVYLGHRRGPAETTEVAAIKVMLPRLVEDAEYVEMFFDEARLTSSIKHPYVCKVLDYGVEDGFHYLATEYVLGETWADLVEVLHQKPEGKAIAAQLLSHIAAQACEALHEVHETCDERGKHLAIVHRDISPQNLMVCYDGTVRVLDFGIASASERLHETRNGVLKGHLAYMAPEQMEIREIDRRCDVWSIGVMLWEGVTGRRLFKRPSSRETMKAVTSEPLSPMLKDCDSIHPSLMSAVERSVVRDPHARFATARDMGIELSTLPLGATSMTTAQVASWMRRLFADRLEQKRTQLKTAVANLDDLHSVSMSGVRLASASSTASDARMNQIEAPLPSHDLGIASPTRNTEVIPRERATSTLRQPLQRAWVPLLVLVLIAGGLLAQRVSKADRTTKPKQVSAELLQKAPSVAKTASASAGEHPPGILEVRSAGREVRVELEGRHLGTTPLRIELTPGRHLFRIVPGGGDAATDVPVVIESGDRYVMDIERADSVAATKQ